MARKQPKKSKAAKKQPKEQPKEPRVWIVCEDDGTPSCLEMDDYIEIGFWETREETEKGERETTMGWLRFL